jgi:coproporphyrinogen III oxidase
MSLDRTAICNYFLSLQDLIVSKLEKEDEKKFHVDSWGPNQSAIGWLYL